MSFGDAADLKVSVVVSTWNRSRLLPRLVQALKEQTLAPTEFEFIVVDNASTDETSAVLESLSGQTEFALRSFRMPVNRGPGLARNRGANEARAAIIAFTDDDCVPSPAWLEAGLRIAREGRVVVGRTEPAVQVPCGPFSRTLRVSDTRYMQTCNVFYARDQLLESGGFDPNFKRGGEDTDLGLRLQKKGAETVFCADALVHHDVRPSSFTSALREAHTKWTDLPLVVKRHPETRRWLTAGLFWKRSHAHVILAIGSLLASILSVWWLVGTLPWMRHRLMRAPLSQDLGVRLLTLPGAFAVDATELFAMVRGSIYHRTLLL